MIRACLFDLDGTLVDSEVLTDRAIAEELAASGIHGAALPPAQTRGRTWQDIAAALAVRYGAAGDHLEARLEARWIALSGSGITPIPGAPEALAAACRTLALAVVSSSPRRVIDAFLLLLGADAHVASAARVGAGEPARAKPAPDGFLMAARRLGVSPAECLVFEDSRAGLEAARDAGMARIAVLHACAEPDICRRLADRAVADYRALPAGFWDALARDGVRALDALS